MRTETQTNPAEKLEAKPPSNPYRALTAGFNSGHNAYSIVSCSLSLSFTMIWLRLLACPFICVNGYQAWGWLLRLIDMQSIAIEQNALFPTVLLLFQNCRALFPTVHTLRYALGTRTVLLLAPGDGIMNLVPECKPLSLFLPLLFNQHTNPKSTAVFFWPEAVSTRSSGINVLSGGHYEPEKNSLRTQTLATLIRWSVATQSGIPVTDWVRGGRVGGGAPDVLSEPLTARLSTCFRLIV